MATAEQQYALVNDGAVLTDADGNAVVSPFLNECPEGHSDRYPDGSRWLPVDNVDSQPMAIGHFRDLPTYEVRGDRVARIYQVRSGRNW